MSRRLIDVRMADGSRHFGGLPERYDAERPEWHRLRVGVAQLEGARLESFATDDVTEAWIDFAFRGHQLSINNQYGEWWFFVKEPACPDEILLAVLDHFEGVLSPPTALARRMGALPEGGYRVVVYEPDSRATTRDFSSLEDAARYADDAASETENGAVLAYVFDDQFRRVGAGQHYALTRARSSD